MMLSAMLPRVACLLRSVCAAALLLLSRQLPRANCLPDKLCTMERIVDTSMILTFTVREFGEVDDRQRV